MHSFLLSVGDSPRPKPDLSSPLPPDQPLTTAPLAAVMVALEDFFIGFDPLEPSLSADGLVWMAKVWK